MHWSLPERGLNQITLFHTAKITKLQPAPSPSLECLKRIFVCTISQHFDDMKQPVSIPTFLLAHGVEVSGAPLLTGRILQGQSPQNKDKTQSGRFRSVDAAGTVAATATA
jgi:hypothetical protein